MLSKITKFILILILFYQNPLYSKSNSFNKFDSKDLSNYFSGIVALENKSNSEALKFFNLSKVLLNQHDPYLKKYVKTLVLEDKVQKAISVVKKNKDNKNTNFFDAQLLLILDDLKKNNISEAYKNIDNAFNYINKDRFEAVILDTLKQYVFVFKEKKISSEKKSYGTLSLISETFQRCYLDDPKTESFFSNLINKNDADYSRYIYFYLSYLIQNNDLDKIQKIINNINEINSTLLLSQGKNWIENKNFEKFQSVFLCQDHNHIIGEFLFLVSNLYSSQDDYERSNFYLYLSNFSNPKFIYNLSLVSENHYFNKDYLKSKKVLKNFKREDSAFFWYRIKKEAQIIAKEKNKKDSLNYISSEFNKIDKPNNKMIFDLANFYKNSEDYEIAIMYYSKVIDDLTEDSEIKSDLLYRRGGSYERKGDYSKADEDLLNSLDINPNDAYVLNYLAYSWLERDYKIKEAIEMLETAYASENDDPYIIDSIGWAYYLVDDYHKAEKFLKRAVELMPNDPIVNDHYGDILWKLNRKIQARYFWKNVLKMEDAEKDMKEKINNKLLQGPQNSEIMNFNKIKSYAKINIALNIICKSNSLHKIESLISFIDFYDTILIKKIKSNKHKIIFNGKFSKNINSNNTVKKLFRILDKKRVIDHKFFIKITKNIPQKAGLGGGSMNASNILKYLINKKLIKTSKKQINEISRSIGSDVILGLDTTNCVLTAKNEVKRFRNCKKIFILVVKPNFGCSTKEIYSKVRKYDRIKFKIPNKRMFNFNYLKNMNNALENIVLRKYPILKKVKSRLNSLENPMFVRMTGSGSAFVSYYSSKKQCDKAKRQFGKYYKKYWCISSKTI